MWWLEAASGSDLIRQEQQSMNRRQDDRRQGKEGEKGRMTMAMKAIKRRKQE
jgi:hypothetical protein